MASSVLFPNPPSGRVVPVIGGYFGHTGGASLNEVAILWDGAWAPLSTGTSGIIAGGVTGLASYSGGLAASGFFSNAGGVAVQGLARWDGAAWHAFADDRARYATMLANLGGSLVAGGYGFLVPGSTTASTGVLRWNGVAWESIGPNPPPQDVFSLGSYRERAVVGGMFHNGVGEPPAPGEYITIFDGASWQPLGTGMNGPVYALCEFDPDGPGPGPALLIAGGTFTVAGGQPASGIAAWDGSAWAPLGSGTSGTVKALGMWRGRLAVGGSFFSAGGLTSPGLAFWGCPQPAPCYANCNGGTTPPVLNVADFTCFLQQYSAGCMGAWPCYPNCDDSTAAPFLNVADFTCFLRKFAAGCP